MEIPENLAAVPEAVRQHKRKRWPWVFATVICAGAVLSYGAKLYQRLTYTWELRHFVQGFVWYGYHETEFSPDGTQIAVAHGDESKVLDLASGKELSRLAQYSGHGISAFSSDGRIVSRFPDAKMGGREAYLWNASDGRLLGRLRLPEQANIEQCSPFFSPDSKKIVTTCAEGLIIWDSSDLNQVGCVKIAWNKDPWLNFHRWNPVTHEMTVVDADGKLLKIDVNKKTATPLLPKQDKAVKVANWSPDGSRLVTIEREGGAVAVWDMSLGTVVADLSEKDVLSACFSPDGQRIVTKRGRSVVAETRLPASHWDRRTRIWDAKSGTLICELPTAAIVTLAPDWSFWVDAGPKGVRIARFDGSELCDFPGWFDGHGSTCVFSPDNRYLSYVNGSGGVAVWRHHAPVCSWTEWLTLYQFWMSILTLSGLAWSIRGFKVATGMSSS